MDHPIFYKHSSNLCIYPVVDVDDIVITGNDHTGFQQLKEHLFRHFETEDLGRLRYFLGLKLLSQSWELLSPKESMLSPHIDHWNAVVRILRFFKGSPGKGLVYENIGHKEIIAYTDADWVGSPCDWRSTSG